MCFREREIGKMAARPSDALAVWRGILLITLCLLVKTTAQDLDGSCQAVKHAYGAKGYNKNDVPRQMIAGKNCMISRSTW